MFTKVYPYLETFHKLYWISLEKKGGIGQFLFFDCWLFICLCTGPVSMFCLLELVAVAPDMLATKFISQLNWIKVCIKELSCGFCLCYCYFWLYIQMPTLCYFRVMCFPHEKIWKVTPVSCWPLSHVVNPRRMFLTLSLTSYPKCPTRSLNFSHKTLWINMLVMSFTSYHEQSLNITIHFIPVHVYFKADLYLLFSEFWGTARFYFGPRLPYWTVFKGEERRTEFSCPHSGGRLHQTVGWVTGLFLVEGEGRGN